MSTAVVYNPTQLNTAVNDADVDLIYFGAHIELTAGITIPATKPLLVFDGTYEGVRYRLTDMNSDLPGSTLGVRLTSSISLTFQHMDMTGRNYYGIPYINDTLVDTSGVSVTYNDVNYTGVQLVFNPLGLTRFEDCTITTTLQEIGEVNRVEFEGVNIISHTSTTSAAFWFRGAAGTAYLRVMPDAQVTVITSNYFMYSLDILSTQIPVAYEVRSNSSLAIMSNHGISLNSNHRVSSFLVDTGASFRYIQQTVNGTNASLYINGSFTVNSGATVYMEANFAGAYPLINFAAGTVLPLSVNNPKSFVMYNRGGAPIALTAGVTRAFTLSGGQINTWTAATLFPQAGGFTDTPYRKWYRPSWNEFNITGNVTSTATSVSGTTLTPDEQILLPSVNDLVFQTARVISVGNLPINANIAANDGRPISGTTEPNAGIRITYTVEGIDYTFNTTAGADGAFEADPQMIIPAGTVITISANTPFLITTIEITVAAVAGEIIIQKAPVLIEFRLPPVLTNPDVLLGRVVFDDTVEVFDDRDIRTAWNLFATITGPLESESGEILEDALVFRDTSGTLWELSSAPVLVYTGAPNLGVTEVSWPMQNGILVRVTEPIRAGVRYYTTLDWTIETI